MLTLKWNDLNAQCNYPAPVILPGQTLLCNKGNDIPPQGDCFKSCKGAIVTYSLNPLDSAIYSWSVAGGQMTQVSTDSIKVTWDSIGTGIIRVKQMINNCEIITERCVEVIEIPVATVQSRPAHLNGNLNVCLGQVVLFSGSGTSGYNQQPALDYQWIFPAAASGGASSTSNEQNTSFSFQRPGIYPVYFVAVNECGCPDTVTLTVNVSSDPSPLISCKTPVCPGERKTYTANITCPPDSGQYIWSIDPPAAGIIMTPQNSQTVTIQWTLYAIGPVFLNFQGVNCTSGCTSVSSIEIPVSSAGLNIQGDQTVCNDQKSCIYSVAQIPGSVFTWTVSNGIILSGQGTNRIEVQWNPCSSAVCVGTIVCEQNNSFFTECAVGITTISILIKPSLQITGDNPSVCPDDTAIFNVNLNPSWTVNWKLYNDADSLIHSLSGTGNQYTFIAYNFPGLQPGNYRLHATSPYFCNEADYYFNVKAAPVKPQITSGPLLICPGAMEIYTAMPSAANQDLLWHFTGADPAYVTGDTAIVQWQPAPPYGILCKIRDRLTGCSSVANALDINIKYTTTLGDYHIEGCINNLSTYTFPNDGIEEMWVEVLSYTDASIVSQDITDSTISIQVQWNNLAANGRFEVHSKTCDRNNPDFSIYYILNAGDTFSILSDSVVCKGEPLNITLSNADNNDLVSYSFGDGTPATSPVGYQNGTIYTYSLPSPAQGFLLSAILTKTNGCRAEAFKQINVLPEPTLAVGYEGDLCTQNPPVKAIITPVPGHTYLWKEAGITVGTNSTLLTVPDITLQAIITNSVTGCSSSTELIIPDCPNLCDPLLNVTSAVIISNVSNQNCGHVNVVVTINGTGWTRFRVNLGNGTTSPYQTNQGLNPSTFTFPTDYNNAGHHPVLVMIAGPNNTCIAQQFLLTVPVYTNYLSELACALPDSANYQYRFTAVPQLNPGFSVNNYSWIIQDDSGMVRYSNSSASPASGWTSSLSQGIYNTRLTLTMNTGLQCYVDFITPVDNAPVPGITAPLSACHTDAVLFDGDADLSYTSAHWDFGDQSAYDPLFPEADIDARRTYLPGSKTAIFTAMDKYGCQYIKEFPLIINLNEINAEIYPSQSILCPGEGVLIEVFDNSITHNIIGYNWNTNSGNSWIYTDTSGIYNVVVEDLYGCTKLIDRSKVYVRPASELKIFGKGIICAGETAEFQCLPYLENQTYSWTSSHLNIVPQTRNKVKVSGTANNSGWLSATISNQGCPPKTTYFQVQVAPLPAPPGLQLNPLVACEGKTTRVEASGTGAQSQYNLNWNNGMTGNPIFVCNEGPLRATVVDKNTGCSSSNQILVHNQPDLSWVLTGCFDRCVNSGSGLTTPFIIPGSPGGITFHDWRWEVIFNNSVPVYPSSGSGPVTALNSNIFYQGPGVYTIRLYVNGWNGCALFSDPLTLTIRQCNCSFDLSNLWTNCLFDDVNGVETSSFSVRVNGFNAGLNGSFTIVPLTANAKGCSFTAIPNLNQNTFFLEGLVSYTNNGLPITYKVIFNAANPLYSCEELITFSWQGCLPVNCADYVRVNSMDCIGFDALMNVEYDLNFDIMATGGTYNLIVRTPYGQVANLPPVITLPANLNCRFVDEFPVHPGPLSFNVYLIDVDNRTACSYIPVTINRPLCPDNIHPRFSDNNQEKNSALSLSITPNPAGERVVFGYSGVKGSAILSISSITGNVINKLEVGMETGFINLSLEEYESGIYIISLIDSEGRSQIKRFLKL